MTYTIKGIGKDKELAKTFLEIQLTARKIKTYPSYSSNAVRVDDRDIDRVKEELRKIKSPRKLKYELSNY